ncbi:hypothetical protein TRVL_00978 [Trypanosoma vivax]|uniref:Uncharacterized protein n=1 Tax=Trypanosoma vivax (strain Y486) TaxID=1055687 RepID=G0UAW6_TRYVY|nr:hypothetical protein TRVL_00978 [Trypanosoma vivax]CCC52953.1 hypothetical protein TVY486_1104370 [Trypanosoma vivax Y486]
MRVRAAICLCSLLSPLELRLLYLSSAFAHSFPFLSFLFCCATVIGIVAFVTTVPCVDEIQNDSDVTFIASVQCDWRRHLITENSRRVQFRVLTTRIFHCWWNIKC